MQFIIGVFVGIIFVFTFINVAAEIQEKINKKKQVLFDEDYYQTQREIKESISKQQKLVFEMVELVNKKYSRHRMPGN